MLMMHCSYTCNDGVNSSAGCSTANWNMKRLQHVTFLWLIPLDFDVVLPVLHHKNGHAFIVAGHWAWNMLAFGWAQRWCARPRDCDLSSVFIMVLCVLQINNAAMTGVLCVLQTNNCRKNNKCRNESSTVKISWQFLIVLIECKCLEWWVDRLSQVSEG